MYSENWTLGMKDYTERVSKHDDASFNYAPNFEKVDGAYCFWSVR